MFHNNDSFILSPPFIISLCVLTVNWWDLSVWPYSKKCYLYMNGDTIVSNNMHHTRWFKLYMQVCTVVHKTSLCGCSNERYWAVLSSSNVCFSNFKGATSRFVHPEKFSLNWSSPLFVICDNLLHPAYSVIYGLLLSLCYFSTCILVKFYFQAS